ncbi:hypothetical protein J6590_043044 [Homalodisca vitripennis]|nr:hypothetical protein J6590_043044 [Homalodisca vitripennis]
MPVRTPQPGFGTVVCGVERTRAERCVIGLLLHDYCACANSAASALRIVVDLRTASPRVFVLVKAQHNTTVSIFGVESVHHEMSVICATYRGDFAHRLAACLCPEARENWTVDLEQSVASANIARVTAGSAGASDIRPVANGCADCSRISGHGIASCLVVCTAYAFHRLELWPLLNCNISSPALPRFSHQMGLSPPPQNKGFKIVV